MKSITPKVTEGQRVKLLPFEDQPEQHGFVEVVEYLVSEGTPYFMYIVRLYKEYVVEEYDDGIREVDEDQLEAL